ncbi:MAG: hypothetical protein ACTS9Y_02625 [Methylophilus sp.]|uniref:hypothetical protein n=1 Tax=Methylophilus sp. TaxID=29541 RepID=UPI003FA12116
MQLHFLSALAIFISGYAPLGLILVIKDLNEDAFYFEHPLRAFSIFVIFALSALFALSAARNIKQGVPVKITKVSNKSADMFTYTIPYMMSFYKFDLGDWKLLLCLAIFLSLMFVLAYRTQNVFVNPVLALAGYGLYDCQFKDGVQERQGLLLSKTHFQVGDYCAIKRLSNLMYFVTQVQVRESANEREQS